MAKLEIKTKENPKLQQRVLSDGRISLYLEYYLGRTQWKDEETGKVKVKHERKKETLSLYLTKSARAPEERQKNRETLILAQEIRAEREQALRADKTGKRLRSTKNINFLDYFQAYIDTYTKKDIKVIKGVYNRFKDFLLINYPVFATVLKPEQLTKDMVIEFVEYLESKGKGEGARGYFKRFKKVVKYATEKDIILKDPTNGIVCKVDNQMLRKDILSIEEMQKLISTKYEEQNPAVRRAFIFCLHTGIRFCDVKELLYSNVDYSNKTLSFEQSKTKGRSVNSGVVIPLNDDLLQLIGDITTKEDKIFNLPSHTMCLKTLRRWTARAGITKHITWHCARHSFAVNILQNGANIKTVASLLGHSGLEHTEKYTRAIDKSKADAINSLPSIEF